MLVNVDGIDYWFLPDGSLVAYVGSISLANKAVTMAKLADLAALSVIGNPTGSTGTPQSITIAALKTLLGITDSGTISSGLDSKVDKATGYSLIQDTLREAIISYLIADSKVEAITDHSLVLNSEITKLSNLIPPQSLLLPASASVSGRISGATIPLGWVIAADSSVNLLVTHTLTGRKIAAVNVFEIDGSNERLSVPFMTAYSGVLSNGLTVLIEGLNPSPLALRIELIFA